MTNGEIKNLINLIIAEGAPGPEHERLKKELDDWAAGKGYKKKYANFSSGARPDVLRGNEIHKYLFCGDAKDSENETVDNADTVKRIRGYFDDFASALGTYKGGILAIATNSEEESNRWVPVLNTLAKSAGITGRDNTPPAFKVECIKANTWIVYW